MKYYLSSYRMGSETEKLKQMVLGTNRKCAYISNASDHNQDLVGRKQSEERNILELQKVGAVVDCLDLRDYFDEQEKLRLKMEEYDFFWVSGGNVFVLRQAMKLSGFDQIIQELNKHHAQKIYGGYSAGVCVLAPDLLGLELVDDPKIFPYSDQNEIIWKGLGLIDYTIVPHHKSDNPESEYINKLIDYLVENKVLFKALKDGEVLVLE